MSTIEVPFGEPVDIDASDAEPKWITAVDRDLHGHITTPDADSRFVLFAGHGPMLIVQPVRITEPSGMASSVHVRTTWPAGARVHTRAQENSK